MNWNATLPAGAVPAPMTVGRILDRVWAILRRNVWLFLKLGSVPSTAMLASYGIIFGVLISQGFFSPRPKGNPFPPYFMPTMFGAMLVATLPMLFAYAAYGAAACHAAVETNRGNSTTFLAGYTTAGRNAARYVWLMILQALCIASPAMLMFGVFAAGFALPQLTSKGGTAPGWFFMLFPLAMLGYLLGMVYAVWMSLRLGLAFPACVTENLTAVAALKRSAALTRKAKGRMFVVLLAIYGISYGVFIVLEFVVFALAAIVILLLGILHVSKFGGITSFGVIGVLFGVLFFVWTALIWAGFAISLSVLYEDQVLRIDGPPAATSPVTEEPA